jgi:DNA primase
MRIDYRQARAGVTLAEVLALVDFVPSQRRGEQLRGPCPVHGSQTANSRSLAAHVGKNVWHCFGCGAGGNVLDLWQALTQLPLHAAVIDLYVRLGRDVPILREQTMEP